MLRTNLVTLKRHIDRRLSKRTLKISTPNGGKVYVLEPRFDLHYAAELHTDLVQETGDGKLVVTRMPAGPWSLGDDDTRLAEIESDEERRRFDETQCPGEEEIYFVSEPNFMDLLDCWEAVERVLPCENLIGWCWTSTPLSWYSSLSLADMGNGVSAVVCWLYDEAPHFLMAVLEPGNDPEVISAFLRDYITDPEAYGFGPWTDMGDITENYRPDLLPRAAVRDAYWEWMTKLDPWDLNEFINRIGPPVDGTPCPEPLASVLDKLHKLDKQGFSYEQRVAALSTEDLRVLFDVFFTACYVEYEPSRSG